MNKEQLAAQLDGREYGKEITKEEEAQAKAAIKAFCAVNAGKRIPADGEVR